MAAPAHPPEVMVVDDDEGMLLLMEDVLRNAGYRVATALSGWAAIATLRERLPDLVLLDLQLKDMAGTALLEVLKRDKLHVPFIVVTGQGDEKVAVEMMKQGALDYVMKDTGILDLLPTVVRRALSALDRERSLAAAEAEGRRLEREILDIGERERQRIGADLHDGVGQRLTAIELMCVGLKDDVAKLDPLLGKQIERITGLLRETIGQTRALARGLAPLDAQPEAFENGLTDLVAGANALGRLQCRLERFSGRPLTDRLAAGHLFRIAQEAVNNALKHSGASQLVLKWEEIGGVFRLEITDDGRGLPKEGSGSGRHGGMGLGIMRYRARTIGAELKVESRAGQGVTVLCVLQVPR